MADSKISAMPAASSVAGADQIPIVQGGVNKRAPVSLIRAALPVATNAVLGGVKIGSGVTVQADGTISVQAQAGTGTDLDYTAATRLLTSSTGADVTLPEVSSSASGLMSPTLLTELQAATTGVAAANDRHDLLFDATPEAWSAKAFTAGAVVSSNGKYWLADRDTVAGDVPGVSGKWLDLSLEHTATQSKAAFNHRVPDSTAAAAGTVLTVATAGADPTWEAGVTGLIKPNNIPQWTDKDWPAGSVVVHVGKYWYANSPIAAGSGGDPGSTGFYPIQLDTILDQLFGLGGYRYPLEPYDDTRSYRVNDVISLNGDWRVVEKPIAVGAGETVAMESSALLDVASLDRRIRLRVKSDTAGLPGSTAIANMVKLTQAAYDALATKDPATAYWIVG